MKAISLLQPWASLVIMGLKTIETRSWNTRYRGEILIHASKGKAGEVFQHAGYFKKHIPDFNKLPLGYILGKVTIETIIHIESLDLPDHLIDRLTLEEKAFGDYTVGRYAWILKDPIHFTRPIPAKGMMSLWDFNGILEEG